MECPLNPDFYFRFYPIHLTNLFCCYLFAVRPLISLLYHTSHDEESLVLSSGLPVNEDYFRHHVASIMSKQLQLDTQVLPFKSIREIQEILCKDLVSWDDLSGCAGPPDLFYALSGHSKQTHQAHYGTPMSLGVNRELFEGCRKISMVWHPSLKPPRDVMRF